MTEPLVNGGLFADSHTHPWRTTPFMKTGLGGLARDAAMARVILSDGAGPLHSYRSPLDPGAAAGEATRQMKSAASCAT
jgi:hypothetical protein